MTPGEAARPAALARLDALVGEWNMEVSFAPGVTGHAVFRNGHRPFQSVDQQALAALAAAIPAVGEIHPP